jgi:hypothetical protein
MGNQEQNMIEDDTIMTDVITTGQILCAEIGSKLNRTEAEVEFMLAMGRFVGVILSKSLEGVKME